MQRPPAGGGLQGAARRVFFCNEKKKGGFGAPPQELLHKPKGGTKGLKFGKWYALLNCHLPPVVKSKRGER